MTEMDKDGQRRTKSDISLFNCCTFANDKSAYLSNKTNV